MLQHGCASTGVGGSTKACKAIIEHTSGLIQHPYLPNVGISHLCRFQKETFVSHHFGEVVPLLFRVITTRYIYLHKWCRERDINKDGRGFLRRSPMAHSELHWQNDLLSGS